MNSTILPNKLEGIFKRLFGCYGHQHWWPGETPFEIMAGAILTQNTSWENASRAVDNLKNCSALNPQSLRDIPDHNLALLIRPSGYFNAKALKLKSLVDWLDQTCGFNLSLLESSSTDHLRQSLLSVHGIGPETADSILLYALERPVFVVDTYTRRIISRIGITVGGDASYDDYQRLFMANLEPDVVLYNEYHALLVKHAKISCKRRPECPKCCINDICESCSGKI
ncbi:MAG: endonuclease III domain-containing protein [Dehalococcoidales bacterium]|jgi:endonuclease-3 related protein|nr:endonuclease III domain-containing protein [Dehalococcoidales bacterium]